MDTAVGIVLLVAVVVPVIVVAVAFVWAARKDGAEDRALQRRLGIRRRTRLGR
jgi:heme/copper-type cytochrome/quinol oxidase subunit 2